MFKIYFFILNIFVFGSSLSFAAGPNEVAKAQQNLWPSKIDGAQSYNVASRAEILVFLKVYSELTSKTLTPEMFDIKKINATSIDAWKERSSKYWLNTFLDASKDCKPELLGCGFKGSQFKDLLVYANTFTAGLAKEYAPWLEMSTVFFTSYVKEQARLAALFPNPTSEILPLAGAEVFGDQFKDGEFLLTFDDGPTPKNGDTEKYTELLRKENISAFFFVLGNALKARIGKDAPADVAKIFQKQCLGSHGFEHKSHQKWTEWKSSLDQTKELIKSVSAESKFSFRPPYGQRSVELIEKQQKDSASSVILWNIDSQDWHSKIDAAQVGDRVQKLMLIWRKGIVLFHDVHKKTLTAVPQLVQFAKTNQLKWVDCHEIK